MLDYYRENNFIYKRKNVLYTIDIKLTANRKIINLTADTECSVMDMYYFIIDILRFENLFEGLFYTVSSFLGDGIEYVECIKDIQLAYYKSEKKYVNFQIDFDNAEYVECFEQWLKLEKENKIIHPIFLYSVYLEGMPVDIRMALLLETFEPIAERFHERGVIILNKSPYKHFENTCPNCGGKVSRDVPNKEVTFADKITPIINKFGKEIFADENKERLVEKSVKIRNKVDHVKADILDAMDGKQCGFYIYKFSLMYRYIMLLELGIDKENVLQTIIKWTEDFDEQYPHLVI